MDMCLIAQLCWTLCDSIDVAHQAPLSMGFTREDTGVVAISYSAGDLPDPGVERASLESPGLAGGFFTTNATLEAPQVHGCWAAEIGK